MRMNDDANRISGFVLSTVKNLQEKRQMVHLTPPFLSELCGRGGITEEASTSARMSAENASIRISDLQSFLIFPSYYACTMRSGYPGIILL